jgi:hypothetical protein
VKAAATVGCASIIFCVTRFWKSAAALPGILMLIPAVWYIGLAIFVGAHGSSLHNALESLANHHWSAPIPEAANQQFWEMHCVLAAANISWKVIARQIPTVLALCFVCSFGTSMDVIAGAHVCSRQCFSVGNCRCAKYMTFDSHEAVETNKRVHCSSD